MGWVRWMIGAMLALAAPAALAETPDKLRIIVLTDIENEPDDAQSLVRFLTYANQWNVEGLVATTSIHMQGRTAPERIRRIVQAYGKVRDNLERHEKGFPTEQYLLSVIRAGIPQYGLDAVGDGRDSPGSQLIIDRVDAKDPRPVWVIVWGGPNVLAQALWKVESTRTPEEVAQFVAKLRVYTVSDQDDSGPWIRSKFPDLFYIASPGVHAGGAYHAAIWSGISGDRFHGRFAGADFSIVDNPWLDTHVRAKGPLGAEYPHTEFIMEGDTPTFLYLIPNGLGSPEHPDWGSWGGRYEFYQPRFRKWFLRPETRAFWADAEDEVLGVDGQWHTSNKATLWRWRSAYQNDFAARMDWSVKSYKEANHPPVARLAIPDEISARPGQKIRLSAAGSRDPDGDTLSYQWFHYPEPGTFTVSAARTGAPVQIEGADKAEAWLTIPTDRVLRNGTMHIVLAVTDNGTPALTRYQRVVVNVVP